MLLEFALSNDRRLEFPAVKKDTQGISVPDTGLTNLTLRVTDSDTATAAIGLLSYTAAEYLGDRVGTYYVDVLGSHLNTEFAALLTSVTQIERFVQILKGSSIFLVVPCVVRRYAVATVSR